MLPKLRVVVLLLVLGLVACLWLLHEDSPSVGAAPAPGTRPSSPFSAEVSTPGESLDSFRAEPAHESVADEPELVPSVAKVADVPALRGRVVLTELDGSEREDASGTFQLCFIVSEEPRWQAVQVERGQWTAPEPVPTGAELVSVMLARTDGQSRIVVEPALPVAVPASLELLVRLRVAPRSILHVVDAQTREELRDVSLLRPVSQRGDDPSHPGLEQDRLRVASGLDSPIDLSQFSDALFEWERARFHVGAPGRAWELAEVHWQEGGETTVALELGATLLVETSGVAPNSGTRLRVCCRIPFTPWLDVPLAADGLLELSGLPPGHTSVAAEIGEWYAQSHELASVNVELRPGERRSVSLVLDEPPEAVTARASGRIHLAQEWRRESLDAWLDFQEVPLGGRAARATAKVVREASERPGFDTFRWVVEEAQVGPHQLCVLEPLFVGDFEVPVGGREDFEQTFGPPAELLVRVVDAQTGAPVPVETVNWKPVPAAHEGTFWSLNVHQDSARGAFVIRSLRVPVELTVWTDGYQFHEERIDLRVGDREHIVRLEPLTMLVVRATSDGSSVALPGGWSEKPRDTAGVGAVLWESHDLLTRSFVVSEPGIWEIDPPRLGGLRELPRTTVRVLANQRTELVLEYERER